LLKRALILLPIVAMICGANAEPSPPPHSTWQRWVISARHIANAPIHRPRQLQLDPAAVAIDTHVHTRFSPDSRANVRDIIIQAVQRGLTAIAITDHNTMDGLKEAEADLAVLRGEGKAPPGFFIIPGEEITSADGHIIALYIHTPIPSLLSATETISRVHSQGGLAIAAHPMDKDSLGPLANSLPFDGVETMNSAEESAYLVRKAAANDRRSAFYMTVTKPRFGASDAHDPKMVGMCYTILRDCAPTPDAIRDALYSGRTQPGDCPAFAARTRGITRSGRWLTWTPLGFQSSVHQDYTPMLRVPLRRGSLALKIDSGTGVLYRKRF
jgi:hypothetical protein